METHHILKTFFLITLASCQNEVSTLSDEDSSQPLSLCVSILGSTQSSTRYGGTDFNSVELSSADQLGLFVSLNGNSVNSVSCWTLDDKNIWVTSPTLYWESVDVDYTFEAFYPFKEGVESRENVPMPSLAEQSGLLDDLANHDFMTAVTTTSCMKCNGTVNLVFTHQLSLLILTFPAQDDLADATIDKLTLSSQGLTTKYFFNFDDPTEFTPVEDESSRTEGSDVSGNVLTSLPNLSIDTSARKLYYVLNPLSNQSIEISITYTKSDVQRTATGVLTTTELLRNSQYASPIVISKNTIYVGTVSISPWGDSIQLDDTILYNNL